MLPQVELAFKNLVDEGLSLRDLIEYAIEYAATMAVEDHADDGVKLDPDDAYDVLVEGIRSASERKIADRDYRGPTFFSRSE